MRLYEFQAKRILAENGISIPDSTFITSSGNLKTVRLPTILKAQVPTGGRGKVGAVRKIADLETLTSAVDELLGSRVKDYPVAALLAEECVAVEKELYIACLIDKTSITPLIMASPSGGMDIEDVARRTPDQIFRKQLDPLIGIQDYEIRAIAKALGVENIRGLGDVLQKLYKIFKHIDATLIEINPLAVTADGYMALDGKIILDDKARYRHAQYYSKLKAEQKALDGRQKTKAMKLAETREINYIPLDGTIGMIADGAGTGMLTMDMISDAGGNPANFCEMGGLSNADVMEQAMEIVLSDNRVKVLLISLIGGLTRMDEMAEGICRYVKHNDPSIPIVIRMCGTKADVGIPMLREMHLTVNEDLATTVETAVAQVKDL